MELSDRTLWIFAMEYERGSGVNECLYDIEDGDEPVESPWGILEYVDSYGGEGQGDAYWKIVKVGDRYFKFDGYYASYDGGYYDECFEVFPKTVTVTQWAQDRNDDNDG